ncbi:hypothetical protein ALC62_15607 [Cyphomyrmex costatus]|uniref:Uncharacterized protein n=1 Tax=Cyphomyrmex costatus TaxID=456900 RepID=A0A151I6X1_9HYME|nr:hypothetical protein ALC62_15607 [Cyphomyrmex costatus]
MKSPAAADLGVSRIRGLVRVTLTVTVPPETVKAADSGCFPTLFPSLPSSFCGVTAAFFLSASSFFNASAFACGVPACAVAATMALELAVFFLPLYDVLIHVCRQMNPVVFEDLGITSWAVVLGMDAASAGHLVRVRTVDTIHNIRILPHSGVFLPNISFPRPSWVPWVPID